MSTKPNGSKEEVSIEAIRDSLADDVFRMGESQLRRTMAELGLDFDASAAEGERLVQELARTHRYESMQRKAADKKRRDQEARASVSPADRREGVARIIRRIKAGDQGLQAAFRDRSPDQMTEAELESIAEDFFWAERLPKGDGGGQG